ncbi:MAG: AAA family ATPase [Deltaproteobacteria bacterium]|nr:AAA family ATPase [Deltaproteobacteria bacterium]MBW2017729.1 AAA family ATPase [Deltaproteobacteria bacterium]MBW2304964.1 AAA family ATPase [Deltaproteobacteria bacterium]
MIRLIEAKGYRCLRYVRTKINAFEILVGPNASGKSTFLDVVRFLGDVVSKDLDVAIRERSDNLTDLFWKKKGDHFDLAVEVEIPKRFQNVIKGEFNTCRYEISLEIDSINRENSIRAERVLFLPRSEEPSIQKSLFPFPPSPPETILTSVPKRGVKTVVNKVSGGNDNFYDETGKGWDHAFKLGPRKSALANLPEDETKFPVSTWFKRVLIDGIQSLVLNSLTMRKPSPPGQPKTFRPDGSNLPWAVEHFQSNNPDNFKRWVSHIRTALPDIKAIETIERPEDRHRYLQIVYENGLKVPSWVLSDGTLRLLALTLLAYLDYPYIYLIEEPENGIHPQAVETVFQAFSSAYEAQILCASHSPVILSLAEPEQVLCFARTEDGATDIVRGSDHPNLKDWQRGTDLGTLFATGVLG